MLRRVLLVICLLVFTISLTLLISIGSAITLKPKHLPEWTNAQAPALEPLLRKPVTAFLAEGKTPGLVIAAVKDDQVCVMGFGRPALTSRSGITGETLFEIGSITKTFTALLLAEAIEARRLTLDHTLRQLLDVPLSTEAEPITLRQLATHTSGFPRLPGKEEDFLLPALGMLLFGNDPYAGYDEPRLIADLAQVQLENPPGQTMEYSNFGVTTLGTVLSREAARDYEEMVLSDICRPLGMTATAINLSTAQKENFATGYRLLRRLGPFEFALRAKPWTDARNVEGAGGLRSTGPDMARYLLAQMHPDRTSLGPAIRLTQAEHFRVDQRESVGLGWMLTKKRSPPSRLIWHNGGTGGFRSFIGFTEDRRHGIVILSNSARSVDRLAVDILCDLIHPPQ